MYEILNVLYDIKPIYQIMDGIRKTYQSCFTFTKYTWYGVENMFFHLDFIIASLAFQHLNLSEMRLQASSVLNP